MTQEVKFLWMRRASQPRPLLEFMFIFFCELVLVSLLCPPHTPPACTGYSLHPLAVQSLSCLRERLWRPSEPRRERERKCACWKESESTFQISSINHGPASNVTNILQLEETRWSWRPSISLTPRDHRFISAEGRESGRPRALQAAHPPKHTSENTPTDTSADAQEETDRCTRGWRRRQQITN